MPHYRSNVPALINSKPNPPLNNSPLIPALEQKKGEGKAKQKREQEKTILSPNYYPPSPIYILNYKEEDAPTLVDSLVPKPTTGEKKDTDKIKGDKTTENRRDLIKIKDA